MRQFASLFIFAGALALSACGSEQSGTIETEDGEATYAVDQDNGETTATITTDEGTVRMRSGENVPVDLPNGFTLLTGARVVSNTSIDQGEGKGSLVIFETDASMDDVTAHYRKQAEDAGVKINVQLTTDAGRMLAGQSEDGRSFSLNASEEDGKTVATLMVGDKLGD